jgi:hypothetical protein
MSYHLIKFAHLFAAFGLALLMGATISFSNKWLLSFFYSFSALVVGSGMILLYRWEMLGDLGLWMIIKIVGFSFLMIIPYLNYKFPYKKIWLSVACISFGIISFFSVTKIYN